MKTRTIGRIIHIFALLHAIVAAICIYANIGDEILLTTLTMAMTLLICLRTRSNIEFTAACIIVVNIFGYILGVIGAEVFEKLFDSKMLIHGAATATTTEFLGWGIVALTKVLRRSNSYRKEDISAQSMKWIILAVIIIFLTRLGIIALTSSKLFSSANLLDIFLRVASNSFALITLICLNIIYIRFTGRANWPEKRIAKACFLILFMMSASFVATVICGIDRSFNLTFVSLKEFTQLFCIAVITQITTYCLVYMCNYTITTGNRIRDEKEKRHAAQYQYQKLKRQVNPHFLFNSLNVLDCMVWENTPEQSSTYIHKLANIYRYMIRSEEEDFVPLSEELIFVGLYIDLLKVRFPKGFEVIINVSEADQARYVLPCSIQLLIENATKHNAISEDDPLIIKIESDSQMMTVSNNIIPKITKVVSTGLGQKYIRQQYLDLSGKEIQIEKTNNTYCVTLPLL
jgi:uncharacterized protein (DUF697 family)